MKYYKLLFLLLVALGFALGACNKEEEEDTTWRDANDLAFAKIVADSDYTKLESKSKNGFIMYKVLKEATGDRRPIFTDKVEINYLGWMKRDWTKGDTYVNEDGYFITNKVIFDSNYSIIPYTYTLPSSMIDGFTTAIINMREGEKWEVCIPWALAYGSGGSSDGSIPAYTMLVFEIELLKIL